MEVLKKNLRLSKEEDIEASYKVTRQQMPSLDVAPNPEVWRLIQRIVSRINPKVQEVDLDQLIVSSAVRNLEESGFHAGDEKEVRTVVLRFYKSDDLSNTLRDYTSRSGSN